MIEFKEVMIWLAGFSLGYLFFLIMRLVLDWYVERKKREIRYMEYVRNEIEEMTEGGTGEWE